MSEKPFPDASDHSQNRLPEQVDVPSDVERILEQKLVDVPDLTQSVMDLFKADLASAPPCQYDFEFISTYFDQQLDLELTDPVLLTTRIQNFEKHLPQCMPCHQQLGLLFEVQDSYRRHLYRLEEQLERFDLSASVMMRFSEERKTLTDETPFPMSGCGVVDYEVFSTAVDDHLSAETKAMLTVHLEQCPPCQDELTSAHVTVKYLKSWYVQAQARIQLDLWPQVEGALKPKSNVVPFWRRRLPLALTGTVAAAMLLFVYAGPSIFSQTGLQEAEAPQTINVAALESALMADQQESAKRQVSKEVDATYNVIYSTPEAYLFSQSSDPLLGEEAVDASQTDVSAYLFSESP